MDHDDTAMPADRDVPQAGTLHPDDPTVPAARRRTRRYHGRGRLDVIAVIAAGGMLGSSARYGVARRLPAEAGGFPWATFWTNLCGSFLLGLFLVVVLERFPTTRYLRPFVASGILGAFTTMSTYEVETALLIKEGHPFTAALYALGSLAAGLVLAYAGIRAGRVTPPRHPEATP